MVPASAASKNVFTCVTTLPRLPPRRRDADVGKSGALGDGGVVRAHEETDVDGIRECNAGESLRDERVADLRHRQDIDAIAPLEPDDGPVRQAVRRLLLFRYRAGLATELERHQAIAVQRRGHMGAAWFERWPNRPAELPMRLDARAQEACPPGDDEVAADPFPDEMKIVAGIPHVLTRARDHLRLLLRVVSRGTCCAPDVRIRGKDAESALRAEDIAACGGTQRERNQPTSRQCAALPVPC